jgi:hypothetical protein
VALVACLDETEGMDEQLFLSTAGAILSKPKSQVNTGNTTEGLMAGKGRRKNAADLHKRQENNIFVDTFETMYSSFSLSLLYFSIPRHLANFFHPSVSVYCWTAVSFSECKDEHQCIPFRAILYV